MKLGRLDDERLGLVTDAGFVDISTVFSPNLAGRTLTQWFSSSSAGMS